MTPSRSFAVFAIVFAVVCSLVYALAVWKNLALFTYHPAIREFGAGVQKAKDGPAMYWYGWIATSVLAGMAAGFVACLLPQRLTQRLTSGWAWIVPLCVMFFFAYLLRNFFLR